MEGAIEHPEAALEAPVEQQQQQPAVETMEEEEQQQQHPVEAEAEQQPTSLGFLQLQDAFKRMVAVGVDVVDQEVRIMRNERSKHAQRALAVLAFERTRGVDAEKPTWRPPPPSNTLSHITPRLSLLSQPPPPHTTHIHKPLLLRAQGVLPRDDRRPGAPAVAHVAALQEGERGRERERDRGEEAKIGVGGRDGRALFQRGGNGDVAAHARKTHTRTRHGQTQ